MHLLAQALIMIGQDLRAAQEEGARRVNGSRRQDAADRPPGELRPEAGGGGSDE